MATTFANPETMKFNMMIPLISALRLAAALMEVTRRPGPEAKCVMQVSAAVLPMYVGQSRSGTLRKYQSDRAPRLVSAFAAAFGRSR
ncbi:hypothetical protein GCM10009805_23610 [Leucobacter chromiireducens subsp. solipictus]